MSKSGIGRRILKQLTAPARQLYRNLQQGPARLPEELIAHGPRLRASAQFGGMGERELQLRMEQIVDRILSSRHSVLKPAQELAAFSHVEQQRFLQSAQTLANSNAELAYQFFHFGISSLRDIDEQYWDGWMEHLYQCYDRQGVNGAVEAMQQVNSYLQRILGAPQTIRLEEMESLIESLLLGFGGRPLKVAPSQAASPWTDTECVYLPERIEQGATREENFDLFKATAAHLWAQTRYGTYRIPAQAWSAYANPRRARRLFCALETLRLDARLQRDLPGIGRILARHNPHSEWSDISAHWARAVRELRAPEACVEDSLRLLESVYMESVDLPAVPYQSVLQPELAADVMARRVGDEHQKLAASLLEYRDELDAKHDPEDDEKRFTFRPSKGDMADEFAFTLEYDGDTVTPPPDVQQLLESIMQDLGEIPDDYLEPAGAGAYDAEAETPSEAETPKGHQEPDYVYPEWDHSRQKYRTDWCHVYERPITGNSEEFVQEVQDRHRRLLVGLRRTFEALRDEEKWMRHEPDGDEVDLNSFVSAYIDAQRGEEMDERLFARRKKMDRDIAVMFLVDMSGSTSGWINDLVRESLVLLCSALETLGDRYAIYGFSGRTHRNCELYPIKTLREPYGADVRRRISGITPRDYTRMGVMIRHLTQLLKEAEARTRLLITLSDGKPDDQDGYRGAYGIEDTRQALNEARNLGIRSYCVTIDEAGMEYLPHMYGVSNFAVVNQISKLPLKVSDIYRRLTL